MMVVLEGGGGRGGNTVRYYYSMRNAYIPGRRHGERKTLRH